MEIKNINNCLSKCPICTYPLTHNAVKCKCCGTILKHFNQDFNYVNQALIKLNDNILLTEDEIRSINESFEAAERNMQNKLLLSKIKTIAIVLITATIFLICQIIKTQKLGM